MKVHPSSSYTCNLDALSITDGRVARDADKPRQTMTFCVIVTCGLAIYGLRQCPPVGLHVNKMF